MENANETIKFLSITDVLGKTVMSINDISSNEINVDISSLTKGVYMVEVTTASNLKTIKKLVIK